jgi:alpha-L-arabinofuranosidase
MKPLSITFLIALLFSASNIVAQSEKVYIIKANELKAEIQPTMWGIFFEDVNMGADGGIYAELVKNRSFEFTNPLMGWTINRKQFTEGEILVLNRKEANPANPRYIQVTVTNPEKGSLGITNEGFRGMGIKKGLRYDFSVMYRIKSPGIKLHVELINSIGENIGEGLLTPATEGIDWQKQSVSFNATATEPKAKLNIWFEGTGVIDLDMISLFPGDTWKNRPDGFRADMVQLLADMKPGFIRFPGGCIVEGRDLTNRYQWKKTIGPVEERQLIMNRWNVEFAHRPTPDYFQSFGLGFFEYFQLAEDIGASPLPILNCGMACQFNTAEAVALNEMDPYVQDALDLIEFANGDVTSKWGKVRAEMGHPKPFNLKMMGIGNENWGPQYVERLKVFRKAIKEKYPDFKLVYSSGTDPSGDRFDYLNGELRKLNADFIDEHYYRHPDWFLQNATRYDNYPRNSSRIFAGEYAAQSADIASPDNKNNLQTALAEAAFMTGLERNADVVNMASYAPLFAHIDGWQWTPSLIWVDNLRSFGTPNYYVQQLFSLNKGTNVISLLVNNQPVTGQDGLFGTACIDKSTNELIIKFVNTTDKPHDANFRIDGVKKLQSKGTLTVLSGEHNDQVNSFDHPNAISPKQEEFIIKGKNIKLPLKPYSFNVIRIKIL